MMRILSLIFSISLIALVPSTWACEKHQRLADTGQADVTPPSISGSATGAPNQPDEPRVPQTVVQSPAQNTSLDAPSSAQAPELPTPTPTVAPTPTMPEVRLKESNQRSVMPKASATTTPPSATSGTVPGAAPNQPVAPAAPAMPVAPAAPEMSGTSQNPEAPLATPAMNPDKGAKADLEVLEFVLASQVERREPKNVVQGFDRENDRGFAHARLSSKVATDVTFVWYRNGNPVNRVTMTVQAAKKWRTYSSVKLRPGQWKVELVANNAVLAEKTFIIE